ncbi:MAG: aspartate kinase [Myxococcales bacterium]|nr:aspartate kinase [Myxococcales bacterium]
MNIVVMKFGGSSVADEDKICAVAERVVATRREGKDVVVVVSAMGKTTDQLLALARRIHPDPPRRELDMLISVGERISMALLSMAVQKRGLDAVSLTGSQSGIITNDRHSDARIIEVRPVRIQDELARGRIVIVAGFQGMSYRREITTLGRGGSDTTAVALAAALDGVCEIYGDVDGVYSADPKLVSAVRHIPDLGYAEMQEMAEHGAKVLNAAAVEFAKQSGIAIFVRRTDGTGSETIVRKFPPKAPGRVVGIAHEKSVRVISSADPGAITDGELLQFLEEQSLPGKQLSMHRFGSGPGAALVVSREFLEDPAALQGKLRERFGERVAVRGDLGAVSLIGAGITQGFTILRRSIELLREAGCESCGLHTSSFRITFLVPEARVEEAVRRLHSAFIESDPT